MADREKFEAFKKNAVKENEEKYGAEIREKYGDEEVDASNRKLLNMSKDEYQRFTHLGNEILERLKAGVFSKIQPESEEAKKIAALHKEWLCMTWKSYSPQAHKGLAMMYIADERFTAYYDKEVGGCAELLEAAIRQWADKL